MHTSIITESCAAYLWRYDLISSFTAVHIFAPISIQAKGVGDKPPTDFEIGPTLSACSRCDLFNDLRSTSLVVSTRSGYTKGSTCREKRRGYRYVVLIATAKDGGVARDLLRFAYQARRLSQLRIDALATWDWQP